MDTADNTEGGTDEKAGALQEEVDRLREKLETATERSTQMVKDVAIPRQTSLIVVALPLFHAIFW